MKPIRTPHKLAIFGVLAGVLLTWWFFRCSAEIETFIGEFPTEDAAMRTAIRKISAEVQRCPTAQSYRMIWAVTGDSATQAILYYRRKDGAAFIGHEADLYSGIAHKPYRVDDVVVKTVADAGGTLGDFLPYSQR